MDNSFYRSEKMAYCELFLQSEMAYSCIAELGELGLTQFTDLNSEATTYQRKHQITLFLASILENIRNALKKLFLNSAGLIGFKKHEYWKVPTSMFSQLVRDLSQFVREIRECDEMERQLRSLETELKKENVRVKMDVENPPAPLPKDVTHIKKKINSAEKQLLQIKSGTLDMRTKRYQLLLIRQVLQLTDNYFASTPSEGWENIAPDQDENILGPSAAVSPAQEQPATQLRYVCGIVTRERAAALERMLWRVGRGNVFFRSMVIEDEMEEDPITGNKDQLNVFLALFQGDVLRRNVLKIASAFHATIFACPERDEERTAMKTKVLTQIEDMKTILNEAQEQRAKLLTAVALELRTWTIQVRKVKSVYHILNMLNPDVTNKYLIGEFWVPERDMPRLDEALTDACTKSGGNMVGPAYIVHRLEMMPKKVPTYFRLNKFTRAYHNIVSAYGVARYREVNPALYTTITFPFLFSIMFGDLGHGIIVLLFGLWMVLKEKSLQKVAERQESFKMIFGGRYVILLMGIFSIHAGIVYNDIFSKSFNIFQTSWHCSYSMKEIQKSEAFILTAANKTNFDQWSYPYGIDPIWNIADNRIVYINAAKMKLSVIIGVAQMYFGLILSLMNHIYFKSALNILCEFIPQILFITCIFVYMDALIFFKWIYFNADKGGEAPSILIGMINMVLFKYSDDTAPDRWISDHLMNLQYALVIVALISIPWMLIVKPLYLRSQHKKLEHQRLIEQRHASIEHAAAVMVAPSVDHSHSSQIGSNPAEGFAGVFTMREMGTRLEHQSSIISSANLPIRSRSNTVTSKAAARKSVVSVAASSTTDGRAASSSSEGSTEEDARSDESDEEKFDFGEVFIHQTIHTIEYVLGLISHTASYLRLWALSLAHAELSEVLWQMVLSRAFTMSSSGTGGFIAVVIIFIFWSVLTIAILCLMEGLSAFLHALRLQWVEFQSKFYGGDGFMFRPFNFKLAFRLKSE